MSTSQQREVWTVFRRLLSYLKPLKGVFIISILALITYGVVDATFIAFVKPFIDEGFANNSVVAGVELGTSKGFNASSDVLTMAPFVVVGLFSLRGLANFVSTYGISYISAKLIQDMRQQVFEHILSLPVSYMDKENTGSLISKVTFDTEQIARASGSALITLVRDSVTVIGMLG